jgi:hypothetical protein
MRDYPLCLFDTGVVTMGAANQISTQRFPFGRDMVFAAFVRSVRACGYDLESADEYEKVQARMVKSANVLHG